MDFVNPLGAGTSQALPVSRLEIGFGHGFEAAFQLPLLRIVEPGGNSVLAAGQFSAAAQYQVAGSARYALSLYGRLEVASGVSTVVGNEIQLMPAVFAEWHARPALWVRSNVGWNAAVSGASGRFADLQYSDALVWWANRHFVPLLEFAGSTSTLTGRTQAVIQPELIVTHLRHVEVKAGPEVAFLPSFHYALRGQVAWYWGKRQ
jgi:hypothetical protein